MQRNYIVPRFLILLMLILTCGFVLYALYIARRNHKYRTDPFISQNVVVPSYKMDSATAKHMLSDTIVKAHLYDALRTPGTHLIKSDGIYELVKYEDIPVVSTLLLTKIHQIDSMSIGYNIQSVHQNCISILCNVSSIPQYNDLIYIIELYVYTTGMSCGMITAATNVVAVTVCRSSNGIVSDVLYIDNLDVKTRMQVRILVCDYKNNVVAVTTSSSTV